MARRTGATSEVPERRGRALANLKRDAGPGRKPTHGVDSEAVLAPLRERYALELAARYPWIAAGRIARQAQRLAQIELGSRWLDRRGGVVRDRDGNVYDVADKVVKWLAGAERWFDRADAEAGERSRIPATSYEGVMEGFARRGGCG